MCKREMVISIQSPLPKNDPSVNIESEKREPYVKRWRISFKY